MSMFNGKININEGKKYDTSEVSLDGMSKEEIEAAVKKNNKLIDIYKAYDTNNDGLSKIELAKAMDGFSKVADADGDGKLSKKELEAYAQTFNKQHGLDGDNEVSGKDMKAFMKSIRKATKDDTKVDTQGVLDKAAAQEKLQAEVDVAVSQYLGNLDAQFKAREEAEATKAKADADAAAAAKAAEEQKAADLKQPKAYTVQPNERLESILKRSLEAQGLEVNDENMAQAKADFIKNNPGALHGPKGKEYLYAADVIKVAGNLEDKANGDEIKAKIKPKTDTSEGGQAKASSTTIDTPKVETVVPELLSKPTEETKKPVLPGFASPSFEPGKEYPAKTPEEQQQAAQAEKTAQARAELDKKLTEMNKYPINEKLPNGYTKRDAPGSNDVYFDGQGNRILKADFNKARGPQSRLIQNMVQSPILEQLPNGYTKRDTPGPTNRCYDKDGTPITEEKFQEAKKAGAKPKTTKATSTEEQKPFIPSFEAPVFKPTEL